MYGATLMHQIIMLMHVKNEVRELLDLVYIHPALNSPRPLLRSVR
jgi:hypothetical protein